MMRQILLLLSAVTSCLALLDGKAFFSTKNAQVKEAAQQYASVAAFHSNSAHQQAAPQYQQAAPQYQQAPQQQQAPSPYSFNYDAEGSSRQESGDSSGKVTGTYSVTNEDGSVRVVKYVADEQGFRADVQTDEVGTKSDNPADVQFKSSAIQRVDGPSSKFAAGRDYGQVQSANAYEEQKTLPFKLEPTIARQPIAFQQGAIAYGSSEFDKATNFGHSAPKRAPSASSFTSQVSHQPKQVQMYAQPALHQAPIQQPIQYNTKPSPYSFNYEAQLEDGSSSRQESSDGSGKVIGSYSLTDADGRKRKINYEADHEGFRASVDTNEFGTKSDSPADVKFLSSAPLEEPIAFKRPQSDFQQQKHQQASSHQSKTSFQQQPIKSGSASVKSGSGSSSRFATQQPTGSGSGTKSQFQSSVHHQQQSRPLATSPVKPSFQQPIRPAAHSSFQMQHRQPIKSTSQAKPSVHQPIQQENKWSPDSIGQAKSSSQSSIKSASASTSHFKPAFQQADQYSTKTAAASTSLYSAAGFAQPSVQLNAAAEKPSPYAFDYFAQLDDGSSSRRESSDGNGRVTGSYSLAVDDGRRRTVDYVADADGFRATVNTNEFGTKEESPADVQFYSSATFDEPAPYSSPIRSAYRASSALNADSAAAYSAAASSPLNAAMYSSQQEDRGPIEFTSGSASADEIYQQTEEDSDDSLDNGRILSSAPQEQKFAAPRAPIAFMVPSHDAQQEISQEFYDPSEEMYQMPMYNQAAQNQEMSYPRYPYSFTYEADTEGGNGGSSRQESADAWGKVTGSYSVTNEDGSIRVVKYVADDQGFRADVQTNEAGTKSDNPADVQFRSDAVLQQQQQKPARTGSSVHDSKKFVQQQPIREPVRAGSQEKKFVQQQPIREPVRAGSLEKKFVQQQPIREPVRSGSADFSQQTLEDWRR